MNGFIKLFLSTALISSFSLAARIGLDARTDFESFSANQAAAKPAYSVFKISRLKLDFQGSLGADNSFRTRIDPLKVDKATAKNVRDGVSSYVDFAFITHNLNEDWSVAMGKIITGMGGVEAMNNPADLYLRSTAGDEVASIYWPTGAQVVGKFGDHKLTINAANISDDVTSSSNLSSTSHLFGLTYTSKLADGMIMPNLSYHSESFNDSSLNKTTKYYLAAGAKLVVNTFDIEFDYLNNNRKYDTQSTQLLDTQSLVALVRYSLEMGSVHTKYETSALKTAISATDSAKSTINGITLAYEFKPVKDDNWRAHIAATQKDTKADGVDTKTEKKIFVGMRLLADFLKQ